MKFLSLTVVEISLTKNLERKKKGQTQGRTNRRIPICNPTIQLVVVDLYTKYEVSVLNGCGDIFDEKVLRNYGRTDGRTDGTTDRCKPVYPPLFQSGGIIIFSRNARLRCLKFGMKRWRAAPGSKLAPPQVVLGLTLEIHRKIISSTEPLDSDA